MEEFRKSCNTRAIEQMSGKKSNNIANAHYYSQKEIDEVRTEEGIDYFKAMKHAANLMKKYSAFTLMVANDLDAVSWNVAYSL